MKKGQDLKIREKLSKSYLQVVFIASISAIVGIGALLIMTRMYNNALTNYGFSQGDIGKAMTVFADARSDLRGAIGYDEEGIIKELKEDYYVKQDSFNTYLAEIEKSMVTKATRDAYNQILADLDGYLCPERGSDRINSGSDGDYCCDHYNRSDNSFHYDWQKIWKSDRRRNFKTTDSYIRTSENICGRGS